VGGLGAVGLMPEEVPPTTPGPRCRKAPAERQGNSAETTRPGKDENESGERSW